LPTGEFAAAFVRRFAHNQQALAFAPGRVNLIGEHTDYNDGFVLPMAIQFGVRSAGRLTDDGRVSAYSVNFPNQPADFAVGDPPRAQSWADYLRAVLIELADAGVRPRGLELLFSGDVPAEAGLSSSAAFAVSARPRNTGWACSAACSTKWRSPRAAPAARCCSTAATCRAG
jgi:galactokinase